MRPPRSDWTSSQKDILGELEAIVHAQSDQVNWSFVGSGGSAGTHARVNFLPAIECRLRDLWRLLRRRERVGTYNFY